MLKSLLVVILISIGFLTACGTSPQVRAEERMFLNLGLEFLGEYQLPTNTSFKDAPVGGLSGITYDRQNDLFYAISDDRSNFAPARFYTLKIPLETSAQGKSEIKQLGIQDVVFLTSGQGSTYPKGTIDAEGIALSPRNTLFISSEGDIAKNVQPFIKEFDLQGKEISSLRIPQRYLPDDSNPEQRGIRNNLGFEALSIGASGLKDDPFRLFTAAEGALYQDISPNQPDEERRVRFLHYSINSIGNPNLIAEHLYLLDKTTDDVIANGLPELIPLEREGYFLSLERTFGLTGYGAKIFQVVNAGATDTSTFPTLKGNLGEASSLKKNLLLDLSELGIYLDNLEGMTLGPRLPDGSDTLLLVSDNNFDDQQVTQFLLFKLAISK